MNARSPHSPIPPVAGIGLRSPHVREVLERQPSAGWLEVHAENYMNRGAAAAQLETVRGHYSLSMHGVGLSLGSARGIDRAHLHRLKETCDRFAPAAVSEHLSWSVGDGIYLNDLLPVPYDEEALAAVAANIAFTQDVLKRPIMIENVSAYVGFARSTMSEPQFLGELVRRTGCGLLLDINNVYVSAHNLSFDAEAYIAQLPGEAIGEYHLAGHAENATDDGTVLIDSHNSCVAPQVWALYAAAVRRFGKRPTLIEWDSDLPSLETLLGEAMWADLLSGAVALDSASDTRRRSHAELPILAARRKPAAVAVCDHHPANNRRTAREHAHA
jgi:hypothetical protein